jgi:acyl-CoA thioesterase I
MMPSPIAIRLIATLGRASRAFAGCLVILASLLVFPNAIPWMIAAWLVGYTLLVVFGRHGLLCLIGCLTVLLGKRPTPAPSVLGMAAVIAVIILISIWHARRRKPTTAWRFAWLGLLALWIVWGGMTVDWYAAAHCRHPVVLKPERPVVCFGDSMTSLGLFGGYPRNLQDLISLPVVNRGIGGVSAKDTVEDHLSELTRLNPQVVVIELGGHDFLRGYSRASTKANLKQIIDAVREIGAEVVLMEIPRAIISDPYWGLEREIARQEDVEMVPDTAMRTIFLRSTAFPPGTWLGEPYLTDETGIHANERGNQMSAECVASALVRLYGPGILQHRVSP